MNDTNQITFTALSDSSIENLLKNIFHSSQSRLKKFFPTKFLAKNIEAKKIISLPIDFVNYGLINPEYDGPEIKIIFQDEKFLVLNKPENIFVHPLSYSEKNNCLSFLRKFNFPVLDVNINQYDRGLLYRLDFETSGVLVYIKSEDLYFKLRENFSEIAKEKIYLAKVEGKCLYTGLIESYLLPSENKGSKMKVSNQSFGKKDELIAKLEIQKSTYDRIADTTLIEIKLITGHRHQIRAQLKGLSHPIIGDQLYGGREDKRLYLHAYKYSITDAGKVYHFENFPNDFQ